MMRLSHLVRETRGGSAAEFALVLPLLLIFLFGIIDVGRLMWTWNRAEKATQMGVRYAVVTDPVPEGLNAFSPVGLTDSTGHVLAAGDSLSNYVMPPVTYTGTSGTAAPTCAPSANCTTMGSINTPAFNAIYNRMKLFLPELKRNAVVVQYSNSGLGYAGDPGAADVAPLVTVSLLPGSIQFQPITLILFKTSIGLPSFSAALTLEDAKGSASN